jgi:IclR family acetate operon transcriptional repressor
LVTPKKDVYYIEVVGKTLDVLEAFVQVPSRQRTLSELTQQLQMNKNAVFRILYSLASHGYITKDGSKYELGPKLVELSNARLRNTDLLGVATPVLQSLREDFGETVNLGILDGDLIRYIGVWESHDRLRLAERVGASDMLHSSALGKAYLAQLSPEEVRSLVGGRKLPALTTHTITSMSALKAELEKVRELGYAVDHEEGMIGAVCIASAIQEGPGKPVAALSISGPAVRVTPDRIEEIGSAVKAAAAEIERSLGTGRPN